jgi:hypothetical protein
MAGLTFREKRQRATAVAAGLGLFVLALLEPRELRCAAQRVQGAYEPEQVHLGFTGEFDNSVTVRAGPDDAGAVILDWQRLPCTVISPLSSRGGETQCQHRPRLSGPG